MTDFRTLCAELLEAWEHELGDLATGNRLANRARVALARWGRPAAPPDEGEIASCLADSLRSFKLTQDPADYPADHWSRRAADLLTRPTPQPPVGGKVRELVAWLRQRCQLMDDRPGSEFHLFTRAADLLERLSPPQPISVSERLPGPELCWWYEPDEDEDDGYGGSWTLLRIRRGTSTYTHWLPAHALPMPADD